MDWSKGFSASYYMAIVDKRTWNDISRLEITGGNISRYITGLRESADIDCPGYKPGEDSMFWHFSEYLSAFRSFKQLLSKKNARNQSKNRIMLFSFLCVLD